MICFTALVSRAQISVQMTDISQPSGVDALPFAFDLHSLGDYTAFSSSLVRPLVRQRGAL